MRKISFLVLFLLVSSICFASEQVLVGRGAGNISGGAMAPLMGQDPSFWQFTESSAHCVASSAGTLKKLTAQLSAAPGAGTSRTVVLRKNASSSSLTCTISNTDTSCSDTLNTVTVAAGDRFSIQVNNSGSPAAASIRYSTVFDGSTSGESFYCGNSNGLSMASATNVQFFSTRQANTGTMLMPTSGTFKNLHISLSVAPGAGKSWAFTVNKSGATSLTCTVSDTNTTCSDTSNSFTVSAGDEVTISSSPTNTPASNVPSVAVTFLADTAGQFVFAMSDTSSPSNTSTNYMNVQSAKSNAFSGTEISTITNGFTAKAIYVNLNGSPGSGKSYTYTLRQNAGSTSLSCAVSDLNTTCSTTTDVTISDNDSINTQSVPSASPSFQAVRVGILGFISGGGASGPKKGAVILTI